MLEEITDEGKKLIKLAQAANRNLIVFDLEHTSGSYKDFGITELAFLKIQPNGEITKGETLFNPEAEIPPMISKITGIWPSMVKMKPKWVQFGAPFVFDNQDAIWIGFNSRSSDIKRIQALHKKLGLEVPSFHLQIDVMRLARHEGHKGSLSVLTKIHAPHINVTAHRAMGDVIMTAELLYVWMDVVMNNLRFLKEK